jgi:lipoate-protein ligase A
MLGLGIKARTVSIAEARAAPAADDPSIESAIRMACFGSLSPYEVVVGERKLVGLAQVRRREIVLWQSGLHLHFDADTISTLMPGADRRRVTTALGQRAVGLDELISPVPDLQSVIGSFLAALRACQDVVLLPGDWTDDEIAYASSQHPPAH